MKNGKLRIALVESAIGFGGSLVSAASLLDGLNRNHFEPILILTRYSRHPFLSSMKTPKKCISKPVLKWQASFLNYFFSLIFSARLAIFCHTHKIDLVHFNNGIAANFDELFFTSTFTNLPLICHQRDVPWEGLKGHPLLNHVENRIHKFIAISQD